jgi:hypothetical protein
LKGVRTPPGVRREPAAEEAQQALEGAETDELRKAEEAAEASRKRE